MMKKLKFSLLAAASLYAVSAVAADDSVYVNLSVLDSLGNNPAQVSAPEPLFPIMPKAPKVTKPAAKKAPKKVAQPQPQAKAEAPAPVQEVKTAEPKPAPQQIPFVKDAEPVVVVDVEPVAEPAAQPEPQKAPVVAPTAVPAAEPTPIATVEPFAGSEPQAPAPALEPEPQSEPAVAEPQASGLLIDEQAPAAPLAKVGSSINFADGVDELDDAQKAQLDGIIAGFEDAANHKIAIYSYNLDDGVDVFKKKRQSLNRAVAVRSYLLPKGYKNFSIKVINVDSASGKANTVELEELK